MNKNKLQSEEEIGINQYKEDICSICGRLLKGYWENVGFIEPEGESKLEKVGYHKCDHEQYE